MDYINKIPRLFTGLSLGILVLTWLYIRRKNSLPYLLQYNLLFGKILPDRCPELDCLRVPKKWFTYFYLVGIVSTLCALCFEVLDSASSNLVFWVLFTYLVHTIRRFYECKRVSVLSNARMSISHFLVGLSFYTFVPFVIYGSKSVLPNHSLLWTIFITINLFGLQLAQHLCFKQLAQLRISDKSSDKRTPNVYYPPKGYMFHWVSCPHYLCECGLYIMWHMILSTQWIPFSHILVFVCVNQICCALMVHQWYCQKFPSWAASRSALIPWIC